MSRLLTSVSWQTSMSRRKTPWPHHWIRERTERHTDTLIAIVCTLIAGRSNTGRNPFSQTGKHPSTCICMSEFTTWHCISHTAFPVHCHRECCGASTVALGGWSVTFGTARRGVLRLTFLLTYLTVLAAGTCTHEMDRRHSTTITSCTVQWPTRENGVKSSGLTLRLYVGPRHDHGRIQRHEPNADRHCDWTD